MSSQKTTLRNLIFFSSIVLLSGWIGHGLDLLTENHSGETPGMLLWLVLPLITMLILRTFAGDGWKDAGLKPRFKGNISWYLIALVTYPVITLTVLLTGHLTGWISFGTFNTTLFLNAFIIALIPNFLKNIPEEFVWRGYLTPKVISLKLNDFMVYLIVGLVWALWHIPYYLFFLDDATIQSVTSLNKVYFMLLSIPVMIVWTIAFVELRLLTGSVWPLVAMHTIEDAFVNPLLLDGYIHISADKELWISPIYGILSVFLYGLLGLGLRQIRKKKSGNKMMYHVS